MASGRGRPREFDRDAALASATRLFWTKGYEATSISDLTKEMGIGSPSLYAAFQSKERLYAEALQHYRHTNDSLVWGNFSSAATARQAVHCFLMDSAAALSGRLADIPKGCMLVLSAVKSEGHATLGELVQSARLATVERLKTRFERAQLEGELPLSTDVHALARYVQTVQSGMSILARDDVSCEELTKVAQLTMDGWDANVTRASSDSDN